jgi:hypothetical protein
MGRHRRRVALGWVLLFWPVAIAAQEAGDAADGEPARSAGEGAWRPGRLVFDWEAGPLAILRNDGRYGENGTEYTADDTGQTDNLVLAQRFALELEMGPRHRLILLYAPLEVMTRVTLERDLRFRGATFPAGSAVEHRYLFDGYRLSYLWGALRRVVDLDVGASFQLRNANVAFTRLDGSLQEAESDIGLVFALKLRLRWDSPWGPWVLVDADGFSTFGLAGETTGAIYDAALSLGVPVAQGLDFVLRARALGGGADGPRRDLENWAHFLSFAVGLRLDLPALF